MLLLRFLLKCSLRPSKANKQSCHQLRSAGTEQEQQCGVSWGAGQSLRPPLGTPGDLPALRLVWGGGGSIAPLCLLETPRGSVFCGRYKRLRSTAGLWAQLLSLDRLFAVVISALLRGVRDFKRTAWKEQDTRLKSVPPLSAPTRTGAG